MSRSAHRAALMARAKALLLYAAVRERYSPEALQLALRGVEREPARAYRCLQALVNSIPQAER